MDLHFIAKTLNRPRPKISSFIQHFAFDSRDVSPGTLFFAIQGEKVDGHQFLREAASQGAIGAVVSKDYRGPDFGLSLLYVDRVIEALQLLATKKMEDNSGKIVGITGSIGKTTAKIFISTLLGNYYRHFTTPKSYNSQISLPISLLNADANFDLYILEMAMSQKGQIQKLVSMAPPHIAVVTRISHSHLEFFTHIDEISEAKAEIFSSSRLQWKVVSRQASQYKAIQSGSHAKTVVYGENTRLEFEGSKVRIHDGDQCSPLFSPPFQETHLMENFLCAATVCRLLNLPWEELIENTKNLSAVSCRFETVAKQGIVFVNDSYNANVDSTVAALLNLPVPKKGRKRMLIFADMKELGSYTQKAHEEVGKAALELVDGCFCLGEESKKICELFEARKKVSEHFTDKEILKQRMKEVLEEGDVVLIKGANSYRLWELLEHYSVTKNPKLI